MEDAPLIIDERLQEDYLRRPRVLCVITTYNRPELLKRAVESVCKQTLEDWFLVVVDDGSSDPTVLDVLGELMLKCENRMEYVMLGENSGKRLGKVRNEGIRSGMKYEPKYVCFLDDDNEMQPTFMDEMVNYLDAHPQLQAAYCDSEVWAGDRVLGVQRSQNFSPAILDGNFIDLGETFYRRELLETHGLFDDDLPGCGEDWAMHLKLFQRGVVFGHYPHALCRYYQHAGQTTRDPGHYAVLEKIRERRDSGYYLKDDNLVKI